MWYPEGDDFNVLCAFLKWCSYKDLNERILSCCAQFYKTLREREIVQLRSQGETLESIGNAYGLTRERVRQIDKKVCTRFTYNQMGISPRFLLYIAAENNCDDVILSSVVESYFVGYEEFIYLMKKADTEYYSYSKQLDGFIVGDDSLDHRISSAIDSLPAMIQENAVSEHLQEITENNLK